jgi:hypothetical protein
LTVDVLSILLAEVSSLRKIPLYIKYPQCDCVARNGASFGIIIILANIFDLAKSVLPIRKITRLKTSWPNSKRISHWLFGWWVAPSLFSLMLIDENG